MFIATTLDVVGFVIFIVDDAKNYIKLFAVVT
jgi:hypothetical protein